MYKVSVIITLYNCESYLTKCLDSIINQTYQNLEILISDDCSTDLSFDIAREFALNDDRIKLFKQSHNLGVLKNYEFLFANATGDFIAIQDADDWSDVTRIKCQIEIFEKYPELLLNGTACTFHYPSLIKVNLREKDCFLHGPTFDYKIVPASLMFKRWLLDSGMGMNAWFDEGTSMDRYFINEILLKGSGYYINKALYHAEVRPGSNHKQFSPKRLTALFLCEELIQQMIDTDTDWLKEKDYVAIKEFEAKILSNKKILSEAYRAATVFDVEFGHYNKAFNGLIKSFSNNININNLKTMLYLLRSVMKNGLKLK